jgi:hypothetical protein
VRPLVRQATAVTGVVVVGHVRVRTLRSRPANLACKEDAAFPDSPICADPAGLAWRRCLTEVDCTPAAISVSTGPSFQALPGRAARTWSTSMTIYAERASCCISALPSVRCGSSVHFAMPARRPDSLRCPIYWTVGTTACPFCAARTGLEPDESSGRAVKWRGSQPPHTSTMLQVFASHRPTARVSSLSASARWATRPTLCPSTEVDMEDGGWYGR